MKTLLIKFALQLLLFAIDGPLRKLLKQAVASAEGSDMPPDKRRTTVMHQLELEARQRGKPISTRLANLAIEAAVVQAKGA